jgi:hypothetical protein
MRVGFFHTHDFRESQLESASLQLRTFVIFEILHPAITGDQAESMDDSLQRGKDFANKSEPSDAPVIFTRPLQNAVVASSDV